MLPNITFRGFRHINLYHNEKSSHCWVKYYKKNGIKHRAYIYPNHDNTYDIFIDRDWGYCWVEYHRNINFSFATLCKYFPIISKYECDFQLITLG